MKISFKNLRKRKRYIGVNLPGLTIALVSFFVISLYIYHESSYDRMYIGADWISKLNKKRVLLGGITPASLIPTFIQEFPQIKNGTLVFDLSICPRAISGFNFRIFQFS